MIGGAQAVMTGLADATALETSRHDDPISQVQATDVHRPKHWFDGVRDRVILLARAGRPVRTGVASTETAVAKACS